VAMESQASNKNIYEWLELVLKAALEGASACDVPCSYYPDNYAGPDFSGLLGEEPNHLCLLLAQSKYGEDEQWQEALARVDPSLIYFTSDSLDRSSWFNM